MSYSPTVFLQHTYCEETAAVLLAVLAAAPAVPLLRLPARLDELAAPCFQRHADCGNQYNVLGFALRLTLPTLPVPPDRAAALADWLHVKLGWNPSPALLMLGQVHPDVPTAEKRRELAAIQVFDYNERHGRLMRDIWRWWADNAPHPTLREPFRELAEAAADALTEKAARERTPLWEKPVIAWRRTIADPHNHYGELLRLPPDLGTPYTLECDNQDARNLQLRRGDVTFKLDVGAYTYLKMLYGWATLEGLPDSEAYERLRNARARLTELAVLLPPEPTTGALVTPYRLYSQEYAKYDKAINRAWNDCPRPSVAIVAPLQNVPAEVATSLAAATPPEKRPDTERALAVLAPTLQDMPYLPSLTLAGLCVTPFTPADVRALLTYLEVVNALTGRWEGPQPVGKTKVLSCAIAAFRVLNRAGRLAASIDDWAAIVQAEYGLKLGRKVKRYDLEDGSANGSLAFQDAVKKAEGWLKHWLPTTNDHPK